MHKVQLRTLPVYAEEHSSSQYQIGEVRLLKHQVETLEAIQYSDAEVTFNTSITGGGKSLAAYLPAFLHQKTILSMYPTNELIQDQYLALPGYAKKLKIHLPHFDTMYSEKISQLLHEHNTAIRLEEVRKLLMKNRILLTNPDLLHLMMSHQYGWGHLRKELPVTVGSQFDYFLFDEFHVFGVPQVIAIMNLLSYLFVNYREKPADRKKFVFLSATPNPLLTRLLERGGLRYKQIEGNYRSSASTGYRCILQPCDLEMHEIDQEHPTEQWIKEHLADILAFFKRYPKSKAAILVSSVATARRLYTQLKEYFEPHGITIGENTGLTSREEREASRQKHILVGTSTVDVGVDFHINYLIFEAFNAGSFLQRFGRLGRHDEFETYRAYALLPRFVLERLQQKLAGEMERETFNAAIREAFPLEQEFKSYSQLWGIVQAAQIVAELQSQRKLDANEAFTTALLEQYERTYGTPEKPVMAKALKKYWRIGKEAPEIIAELSSFRGQSPLSCAVWDTDDQLKTYDLFFLLTNTEFEVMDKHAFMQEVRTRKLEEHDFEQQLLYLRVHKYIAERLKLVLGVPYDVTPLLNHIQVLHGITILEPHPVWRDKVNFKLKQLKLPAIVSDMERAELKGLLHLDPLFPVYRLQDGTGNEYALAFGQSALLLDSLLFFRKTKGDRAMML